MAPESERANVDKVTVEERWYKDGRIERKVGDGEWEMTQWPQNPPFVSVAEPTLTCSEVVERLNNEAMWGHGLLDHAKAEAILHSWRERRVQELEELLREIFSDVSQGAIPNHGDPWFEKTEKALAISEWREQIRKGAKHE